jgi:hypothetical protein
MSARLKFTGNVNAWPEAIVRLADFDEDWFANFDAEFYLTN